MLGLALQTMPPLRLLVTGAPGIGKTTLCSNVWKRLQDDLACRAELEGFLCHERSDEGKRVEFEMVTLDGKSRGLLASIDGPVIGQMVGKYHVQIQEFEDLSFPVIDAALNDKGSEHRVFIFDEIGKMELKSEAQGQGLIRP